MLIIDQITFYYILTGAGAYLMTTAVEIRLMLSVCFFHNISDSF